MQTHRKAGSRGGNQYGAYKVRYASERQQAFIKKLLDTKEHSFGNPDLTTINVQGATELIGNLMKCSDKKGFERRITSAQLNFLMSLVGNKPQGEEMLRNAISKENVKDVAELLFTTASALIEDIKNSPSKQIVITNVGAYRHLGVVYSIRKGRESGRLQVWSLDSSTNSWTYDSKNYKVLYDLLPEHRLTLNEAVNASAQTGSCVHCGRTLSKLTSVAMGMGKICASKY
jgi:hypothetical protein